MNFFLYILRCSDDFYYVGHTENLEKRLSEHNLGLSHYTQNKRPLTLVYQEKFDTRNDAFNTERKLKSWSRIKKGLVINEGWQSLYKIKKRLRNMTCPSTSFDKLRINLIPVSSE